MEDKFPNYELKKVFEDGSSSSLEVIPIFHLPGITKMDRRGFLGVGITGSAIMAMITCSRAATMDSSDANSSKKVFNSIAHRKGVGKILYSPDGKWLVSKDSFGFDAKLWEMPSGKLFVPFKSQNINTSSTISFSQNGEWLAISESPGTIEVWNLVSLKLASKWESIKGDDVRDHIWAISLSPDGKWIASGNNSTIKLWEIASGKLVTILEGHKDAAIKLLFSSDGKWLASKAWDKTIKLWEIPTGNLNTTFAISSINDYNSAPILFSPDNKWIASKASDSSINLWEISSGIKKELTLNNLGSIKDKIAFSPDGKCLAGTTTTHLCLWEIASGKILKCWKLDGVRETDISFSSEGKYFAWSHGNKISIWEMPKGKLFKSWYSDWGINSIVFSPDGKWLVSGGETMGKGILRIWNIPSATLESCLFDPAATESGTETIQYTSINEYGQVMTYTLPCGSPLPAGAACTCNCVPGTYIGESTTNCTCNQVCTCVPVFH